LSLPGIFAALGGALGVLFRILIPQSDQEPQRLRTALTGLIA